MGTVYLCDRCHKEIKPTGLLNLLKSRVCLTKLQYVPSHFDSAWKELGNCKILCDDCGSSFSKWWNDPSVRKENAV